jgi:hypothetical protein
VIGNVKLVVPTVVEVKVTVPLPLVIASCTHAVVASVVELSEVAGEVAQQLCNCVNTFGEFICALLTDLVVMAPCTHEVVGIILVLSLDAGKIAEQL